MLTMLATAGTEAGSQTTGRLWLARTSAADRSPRTGEGPPRPDTLGVPLYGATTVDFDAVAAILGDPSPLSVDPIYPGVLVHTSRMTAGTQSTTLLIGTLGNSRNGSVGLDGSGIGLDVLAASDTEFSGTWGPYGIVTNGSGYFCARRQR